MPRKPALPPATTRASSAAVVSDGRIRGVRVQDLIAQREVEVTGQVVVNASGPWFDRVAGVLQSHARPRVRTTRGIHIACANPPDNALALPSAVDGRLTFVIPWLGYAWVGTTDIDYDDDPADVARDAGRSRVPAALGGAASSAASARCCSPMPASARSCGVMATPLRSRARIR